MESVLLHSCCGPCSSYVLENLSARFGITVLFFNPNIMPAEEYTKRLETQKQLLNVFPAPNPIRLIEGEYDSDRFLLAVRGLEGEPEKGKRCRVCFHLRLAETARLAKEMGFDYFTTTLSVSPHKNADVLADISRQLSEEYGVKALPADYKKDGGYQRSVQLAKLYGLYRQNYCGCVFEYCDTNSQ